MGQRDPLVEFKAEAFSAFQSFQESLKQEIVRYLFHAEIQLTPAEAAPLEGVAVHPEAGPTAAVGADTVPASVTPVPVGPPVAAAPAASRPTQSPGAVPPVSRNALCPCGSGRKYKRCHGAAS